MTRRLPRQDSTMDQLSSVATALRERGELPQVVAWLCGTGDKPDSRADVLRARRVAVDLGCYDADDWMAHP